MIFVAVGFAATMDKGLLSGAGKIGFLLLAVFFFSGASYFVFERAELSSKQAPQAPAPPQPPDISTIPCPLCSQQLQVSTLKQGENSCPHCLGKFVAE